MDSVLAVFPLDIPSNIKLVYMDSSCRSWFTAQTELKYSVVMETPQSERMNRIVFIVIILWGTRYNEIVGCSPKITIIIQDLHIIKVNNTKDMTFDDDRMTG